MYVVHTGHSLCSFCMTAGGLIPWSILSGHGMPSGTPIEIGLGDVYIHGPWIESSRTDTSLCFSPVAEW